MLRSYSIHISLDAVAHISNDRVTQAARPAICRDEIVQGFPAGPSVSTVSDRASMNVRLAAVTTILVHLLGPVRFVIGEQFFPDVITTKSGEKIEGRITAESGDSVTVSIERQRVVMTE